MKKLFIIFLAAISCYFVNAQSVGIGTNAPNASAQLDITSTTKGMLPPRMTTAQRIAIVAPANGLMVYDTNFASFYFYNGSAWAAVNSGDGGGSSWTANGNNIFNSNAGNVGIGSGVGLKEKLSIKGNLFVTHTNPNDLSGGNKASINLHGANTGSGIINFLRPDTTTGASIIYGNILSQFILQNGSNLNQLFLRSNGNVGVGSGSPLEKLDVNGNIRSRNNILADNDITLTGNLQAGNNVTAQGNVNGGSLTTGGNILVSGTSFLNGDVTTNSDITINNTAAILQLKSSNVNKGFFQLSGNDVRFGTNSGNTSGDVIVRMDGDDLVSFRKSSGGGAFIKMNVNGVSTGVLQTTSTGIVSLSNSSGGAVIIGGEIFINDATSKTGIGTSNPTERLHVNGNTRIGGSALISGATQINGATTIFNNLFAYKTTLSKLQIGGGVLTDGYDGMIAAGYDTEVPGFGSTGIGNKLNVTGDFSNAIGGNVNLQCDGCMALTDGQTGSDSRLNVLFNSPRDVMYMRFNGGYKLLTSRDFRDASGVQMGNGANGWSSISDSTKKENFIYANGNAFLKKIAAMRLGSWNYKSQNKETFRHYGPMAQEFYSNFGNDGIGKIGNDTTIATTDIDGVMMIALQALIKENEALKSSCEKQATEISKLKENEENLLKRLEKIEAILSKKILIP